MALLWLLNMSDGQKTVLDIASRSGLPWDAVKEALRALISAGLLKVADPRLRHTRRRKRTTS
jgi:aminopeptidase-like protein